MRVFLAAFIALWGTHAFAISCDCEVQVYAPMTGSHRFPPSSLASYELEEFNRATRANQFECRRLCLDHFEEEMPADRLNALLLNYSARLVDERVIGYNCTGLTTLKYPVRVKAKLGNIGLGNVADFIQVVNHEEACF